MSTAPSASSPIIRLTVERGAITGPRGPVLTDIALSLSGPCSVVLLGPVGTGKSALMRALTGQPDAPGFRREGLWQSCGVALPSPALDPLVRWLPQARYRTPHAHESFSRPPAVECWQDLFTEGPIAAFLDEPVEEPEQHEAVIRAVRAFARQGLVVTITHHLEFARAIADEVLFVGDGRVQLHMPADTFFSAPPTREVEQWIRTGSCSWPSKRIEPTRHFRWILPGRLGAMGRPGLNRDMDEDLAWLVEQEVRLLITLTREPMPTIAIRSHGLENRHLPIPDMGVPSLLDAAGICGEIERRLNAQQRVVVHCRAGLGRTGTIIACALCWLGLNAELAVKRVREVSRGFIQTPGQLRFVQMFDEAYGGAGRSVDGSVG